MKHKFRTWVDSAAFQTQYIIGYVKQKTDNQKIKK